MRLLLTAALVLASAASAQHSWRTVLDAIKQVETGSGSGINVRGDGGRAFGPYQIHKAYWQDSRVPGTHAQCLTGRAYSELVVESYMRRYCGAAVRRLVKGTGTLADIERIARQHNGGPKGHLKRATLGYWKRVEANL